MTLQYLLKSDTLPHGRRHVAPAAALTAVAVAAILAPVLGHRYAFAFSIFIYVVVNLSMVLGLLPIVGSPLPILSYGGSSMMAIMLGLGIVMSCKVYKDTPVN